eukprot:CAMPEP_0176252048 /NCGR_PEP_ID=MMETSP0121_2-20121125/35310_1 /TAXON_ID=160619 /ORGANISM="Kryptoperidinium foliaceum, Strain CCMP 1326" /LENGTH=485 /DNA_ID=CAMNT_0017591803 /DNA_START=35 /DNA_END=1492 /DNA_ORIENTATION=+
MHRAISLAAVACVAAGNHDVLPFNCDTNVDAREPWKAWSVAERAWCCKHRLDCSPSASAPLRSLAGEAHFLWPGVQQVASTPASVSALTTVSTEGRPAASTTEMGHPFGFATVAPSTPAPGGPPVPEAAPAPGAAPVPEAAPAPGAAPAPEEPAKDDSASAPALSPSYVPPDPAALDAVSSSTAAAVDASGSAHDDVYVARGYGGGSPVAGGDGAERQPGRLWAGRPVRLQEGPLLVVELLERREAELVLPLPRDVPLPRTRHDDGAAGLAAAQRAGTRDAPAGLAAAGLAAAGLATTSFWAIVVQLQRGDLAEFNTWPRAQQEWCCADMGVGCSDEQNPPAQPMSLILPEHALSAEALPAQSPAPAQSAEPPVPGAMDPQPHKHVVPETHLRGADFDESEFLPPGVEQFLQKAQRQDVAVTAQTHGFLSGAVLAAAVAVSGVAMLVVATRKVVLHRFVDGGEVRLLSRTLAMTQEPDQFADVPE